MNDLNKFILLLIMQLNISLTFLLMHNLINLNDLINLNHFTFYINVIHYKNKIKINYD